jgi:hypothetical protein
MRQFGLGRYAPGAAALRLRRQSALTELVRCAERAGSYAEPWDRTPRIWESYDSEAEILRGLHQQWRTELAGAVFTAIERGRGDLCADVGAAYAEVLARHAALKRILDAYADHPAIASAIHKERALLSAAAGALRAA